jgi:hypothetical protein
MVCLFFTDPVKMEWSELARCLLTLKSIATNDECLDDVLAGLVSHNQSLLKRFQQVPPSTDIPLDPHKCLSGLLHTLILVSFVTEKDVHELLPNLLAFVSNTLFDGLRDTVAEVNLAGRFCQNVLV